jgi:hypothetical protein
MIWHHLPNWRLLNLTPHAPDVSRPGSYSADTTTVVRIPSIINRHL